MSDEPERCAWCEEPITDGEGIHYEPDDPNDEEGDYCSIACWLASQ